MNGCSRRAGFGPKPGEAKEVARKGLKRAVDEPAASSERPARRQGTNHQRQGEPLSPRDAWGHGILWWLDRMVRSNQPLVERHRPHLARLVRDVQCRRRLSEVDADPDEPLRKQLSGTSNPS